MDIDGPEEVVESEIVVEAPGSHDQYNVIMGDDIMESNEGGASGSGETICTNEDGNPVFSQTAPNFLEAADLILTGSDDSGVTCDAVPAHFFGPRCSYLLDLDKFQCPVKRIEDLCNDGYPGWRAWGTKDMYFQETGAGDFVKMGGAGKRPPVGEWDLLVHEYRMFHPQRDPDGGDGKLTKRIYAIFSDNSYKEITGRWVMIVYEWRGTPFDIVAARRVVHKPITFANRSGAVTDMRTVPGPSSVSRSRRQPRAVPRPTPEKKRKRSRQVFLPGEGEVGEEELLDLERDKLQRHIEILDMQKIYLSLKIEKEQKIYDEHQAQQRERGQNFPHETVEFVQVATTE